MKACERCNSKFDGDGKICPSCLVEEKLDSGKSVDSKEVMKAIFGEYGK